MVKIVGNGHGDKSPNPGRGNCISFSANTLGKGMDPTPPQLWVNSRADWAL